LQIVHVFNGEGDTTLTVSVGRAKKRRMDWSKMWRASCVGRSCDRKRQWKIRNR